VRNASQRGVTLIELMIAITLVAALSSGMLIAIRTSLMTLEKVDNRLQDNRRVLSVNQILSRQIGGVMPVMGQCGSSGGEGFSGRLAAFNGNQQTLHLVSSYSLAEGARGFPRVLELQVIPADGGGVRLIVNEALYTGPRSLSLFCIDNQFRPGQATPQSFVLADRLAYCRISYQDRPPDTPPMGGKWLQAWTLPELPAAVHFDMAPLIVDSSRLPLLSVTVPLHITREVLSPYADSW
jgi:prepilin-type N-terminal cleavage/methylation domain-containing protein